MRYKVFSQTRTTQPNKKEMKNRWLYNITQCQGMTRSLFLLIERVNNSEGKKKKENK